jgi:hypothetical protein
MASLQDILGMPRTMEPSTATYVPRGKGVKQAGFKYTPIDGGMKVNPFGMFGGAREDLEDQFSVAREDTLSTVPNRGGQLNKNLYDLGTSRAKAVGGLKERVIGNALNAASGVASSGPQAIMGMPDRDAARQATETQIKMANAQAGGEKKSSTGQMIGQAVGMGTGAFFGGPTGAMIGGSLGRGFGGIGR